jgi:hypothetical protein
MTAAVIADQVPGGRSKVTPAGRSQVERAACACSHPRMRDNAVTESAAHLEADSCVSRDLSTRMPATSVGPGQERHVDHHVRLLEVELAGLCRGGHATGGVEIPCLVLVAPGDEHDASQRRVGVVAGCRGEHVGLEAERPCPSMPLVNT